MEPIHFPEENKMLLAPESKEDLIDPLPVWTDGKHTVSCWRMTWRDRLSALLFGRVWLWVWYGSTQPPVMLTAERSPFKPEDA